MGCSDSKSIETNEQKRPIEGVLRRPTDNSAQSNHSSVPKSVAFEVSLDESAAAANGAPPEAEKKPSLPKRLLSRLQDEPSSPEMTAEQLLAKQRKAEERRLQVLDERQSKARASVSKAPPHERIESRVGNREDDEEDERSRTPPDTPVKQATHQT